MKHVYTVQQFGVDPLAPTIFHEPWWLKIASDDSYKFVEVESKGEVVGRLPYFPQKKFGFSISINPGLVHTLGPAINSGEGSLETRRQNTYKAMRELIDKLPPYEVYRYKCLDSDDVIPFQQKGFMTRVQFTHEIEPKKVEQIWETFSVSKRSEIRRAEKRYDLSSITPDEFFLFYDQNIEDRGLKNVYRDHNTAIIIQETIERKRGKIYAARAKDSKNLVAAIFVPHDNRYAYYFMSTRSLEDRSGAISFLIWEAIKDAAEANRTFDFDGLSSKEGVAFFDGFGAHIKPRYIVTKTTLIGSMTFGLKECLRPNRFFC